LWLVAGFTAFFLAFSWSPPAAAAEPIAHIRVEGAQRIETATVLSYIDLQPGDPFEPDRLDHALKALFATGLFADVSLYQEGRDLVIVVVENPIINQIAFEGNKKVKSEDLQKEVQLQARSVLTRTKVQADVERLQELYRVQGRFSADIQPKIIKLDQNRVNLVFEIAEGPQTYISRITFVGNKHFDEGQLQKVVRSQETRWWRFWSGNDKYDPDRLAYDREQLRKFYLDHGYADFRVEDAVAELSPDHKAFYVTFVLDEGDRYKVGTVNVVSYMSDVDGSQYKKYVTVRTGDWYKASDVEKTVNKLTEQLENKQHPFIDVKPDVQRSKDKRTVDIVFNVNEGQKLFVENINISGNTRTLDSVIRREMKLSEGDPFNLAKLKQSEQRLKDLGFFETVAAKPVPGSAPDKTNIDVTVAEKSTGSVSLGGGFSTQDGPLGDFSISEKNFLGTGREADLTALISGKRQEFDLSITEPHFLDRDMSAGIDLFHSTTNYQSQSSYDYRRTGAGLRIGYPLSEHWRQDLQYQFSVNNIFDIPAPPLASDFIIDQAGTRSDSFVAQALTYDTRDSKLDPTEGILSKLSLQFAGAGGNARFYKGTFNTTLFYPVADKWTLRLGGEVGDETPWGGDYLHIEDRFFVGGAGSLRGFEQSGIGPRDPANEDALGGDKYYRGSVQLEFPSGLPEDLGVRQHVFSDFGALWGLDDPLASSHKVEGNTQSLRVTAGYGVSWHSPLGLVQADLGFPARKETFDKTQVFSFNFGTKF
jgi:outer membrane protein insertion porin family